MKTTRRNFLNTACRNVVLASLGISIIEACSTENMDDDDSNSNTSNPNGKTPLTLDLNQSTFSALKTVGGWINYTAQNILLVRISANAIRVFDNKCPHEGNRDRWSYSGTTFTCGYHNNSYENSCNGALKCYTATLDGNMLTISF